MSAAPTTPGRPTPQPAAEQAGAGVGASAGTRVGQLLWLVGVLTRFGKLLVTTLQQGAANANAEFARHLCPFGTTDLAMIIARITRGLRLAAALEARLSETAASGRDITRVLGRLPSLPSMGGPLTGLAAALRAGNAAPLAGNAAASRAGNAAAPRAKWIEDPRLAAMPSAAEIAADVRRRPIGVVIADICRDLGVNPANAGELWKKLQDAVSDYGGDTARLYKDVKKRFIAGLAQAGLKWNSAAEAKPAAVPPPDSPTPACPATGPP